MKLEYLKCPVCKNFELKDHPSMDMYKDTIFNYMLKCSHCGYAVDKQTHENKINKGE